MSDSSSLDYKFVESYFKDKFLKPFARRLKYIYFGFDNCDDTFILSDTEDLDFKYCESMQTTGLIKIKNKEHSDKIFSWFDACQIDRRTPCIFYFSLVTAFLNKIKWEDPTLKITRDQHGAVLMSAIVVDETNEATIKSILIARPIDTHFTLTRLQGFVDKYIAVFFNDQGSYYDEPVGLDNPKSTSIIPISCLPLYEAGLLDVVCEDVKLILLSGLDILVPKSLITPEKDYKIGIRLWADNGKRCINYGSFYKDVDVSICTSRDNIFIFPKPKKG